MDKTYCTPVGRLRAEEHLCNFAPLYDSLAREKKPLVVYGCGPMTELLFSRFDISLLNVVAFSDGDHNKWGREFYSKKIIAPTHLEQFPGTAVLIISGSRQQEIKNSLQNLLKTEHEYIFAGTYFYYNLLPHGKLKQTYLPLFREQMGRYSHLLAQSQRILCLMETEEPHPFFLYLFKQMQKRGKRLKILTRSVYTGNGLRQRGFDAVDIHTRLQKYKKEFLQNKDVLQFEGDMIAQLEKSVVFDELKIPDTHYPLFESVFYDRLIHVLEKEYGEQEYVDDFFKNNRFDTLICLSPPDQTLFFSFFLKAVSDATRKIVFCSDPEAPYMAGMTGQFALDWVKETIKPVPQYYQNLDDLPINRNIPEKPVVLVPFSYMKRWETREILKALEFIRDGGKQNFSVILKCSEKMNSFNGFMSDSDYCRIYFKQVLIDGKTDYIVSDGISESESVDCARVILGAENNRMFEIAAQRGKRFWRMESPCVESIKKILDEEFV